MERFTKQILKGLCKAAIFLKDTGQCLGASECFQAIKDLSGTNLTDLQKLWEDLDDQYV